MFAHIYIYVKICVRMCVCIYTHNLPKQLSKLPVSVRHFGIKNSDEQEEILTNVNSLM